MLNSKDPFDIICFGLYEYILCRQFLEIQNGIRKDFSEFIRYHISMDAGIFYEILKIKFDIALISCGSYGIPLALKLKKSGKKVI